MNKIMKYLKKYNESIDFDDISEEEFDNNIINNIHIKPGDILLNNQYVNYWKDNRWGNYDFNFKNSFFIDKIELSDNITSNPYDDYNDEFKKIPDGEIIFSIKNHWPWYKYDKNLKIK